MRSGSNIRLAGKRKSHKSCRRRWRWRRSCTLPQSCIQGFHKNRRPSSHLHRNSVRSSQCTHSTKKSRCTLPPRWPRDQSRMRPRSCIPRNSRTHTTHRCIPLWDRSCMPWHWCTQTPSRRGSHKIRHCLWRQGRSCMPRDLCIQDLPKLRGLASKPKEKKSDTQGRAC